MLLFSETKIKSEKRLDGKIWYYPVRRKYLIFWLNWFVTEQSKCVQVYSTEKSSIEKWLKENYKK